MKKIYFVLFAILCTIVFSCTDNLISTDLDSHKNSSTGELKVFVKQSRLFSPEINNISLTVELVDVEKNTYSSKEIGSYYLFSGLQSGIYYVTASGKDSLGVERFSGSITINFDSTEPLEIHVPVVASKPNNDTTTSTGFATITMEMSEELLSLLNMKRPDAENFVHLVQLDQDENFISATFVQVDEETGTITILNNQKVDFVDSRNTDNPSTSIPVGYYYLTFSEFYPYSIKLKDNLVEIGDGLTTNIVLTENDYEIVENYSSILYVNNEGGETADGKTLSNPIAFSSLNYDNFSDAEVLYLLSDVEFTEDANSGVQPSLSGFYGTISSFGSTVRTISSPEGTTGQLPNCTLKNIKLSGIFSNIENNLYITIEDTVILDCKMASNKPIVYLSKSSNLVVGKNFSGDLYLSLVGEWNLGDTVINFENGKPENSNFYIEEYCCNSQEQYYSAMFYIDDSGKLAKYTDDFTSFAWSGTVPHLVTKTQAKNNTYTSINGINTYDSFTGISTYDEENQTWYFICEDASGNTVPSLYKVSAPTEYTDSVTPEKICEVKLGETGQTSINVQDIYIYNGKIYLCNLFNDTYEVYVSNLNDIDFDWKYLHSAEDTVTALLVENDIIYIATTTSVDNSGVTHSEIWRYKWDSDLGYTTAVDTYSQEGKNISVPYYQTVSDNNLKVGESFPEGSTFRITDLYSDANSVYGLLANYIEKEGDGSVAEEDKNKSFMRGSVFKLEQNTSRQNNSSNPIMNATHLGLRNSFPLTSENLATAKQYFILPRKIVGVMNKKLVIVDDGMVPDSNDCNVDRFALFDLAGEISETIDVGTSFTTQASVSSNKFFTFDPLFDAQ